MANRRVFTEAEWKRWWESTRKALKASGAFSIPAKKTEPIQIRGEGVSHADELLAAFNKARQPKTTNRGPSSRS
jgi:transcription elongation factor GreA-like protein